MSDKASVRRQKLLQRALPALIILVIYFSFIAPKISAATAEAAAGLQRQRELYLLGQEKMRDLARQKKDLMAELNTLRQQGGKSDEETVRQTGFLGMSDYAGKAIGRLDVLLARYNLRVVEDGRQDWSSGKDSIPTTVSQLGEPVHSTPKTKSSEAGSALWRVRFKGTYPDVYRMLDDLSRDNVTIIPVSLDMIVPEGDGDLEWTIRIWI